MDFGSIGLITALVGTVVVLVRLLEHLIIKKKQNGHGVLTDLQADQLENISRFCSSLEIRFNYLAKDLESVKQHQASSDAVVAKLINSHDRVIEKMDQLISKMDKLLERTTMYVVK